MNFQAPPLSRINKFLIITVVALFLIHSIGRAVGAFSLVNWMALSVEPFWKIYTLFTYPWIETELMSVLFNGLLFWFLGSELERQWGEKIYIKFLLTSVVLSGVFYLLLTSLLLKGTLLGSGYLMGTAGISYALCVAYATIFPDRQFLMMFVFPVKAKWFCLIMAAVQLYMGFFSGNASSWGHLFSMGVAYLLIRYQTQSLVAWWFKSTITLKKSGSSKKGAAHLKLVRPDDKDGPKYWH
jgi:membrane associated rhomboid family serine protease